MGGRKDRATGAARVGGDDMSGEGPGGLLTQTAVCDGVTALLKHTGPHRGTATLRCIARCVDGRRAANARIYAESERPNDQIRQGPRSLPAAIEGRGILPYHPYDLPRFNSNALRAKQCGHAEMPAPEKARDNIVVQILLAGSAHWSAKMLGGVLEGCVTLLLRLILILYHHPHPLAVIWSCNLQCAAQARSRSLGGGRVVSGAATPVRSCKNAVSERTAVLSIAILAIAFCRRYLNAKPMACLSAAYHPATSSIFIHAEDATTFYAHAMATGVSSRHAYTHMLAAAAPWPKVCHNAHDTLASQSNSQQSNKQPRGHLSWMLNNILAGLASSRSRYLVHRAACSRTQNIQYPMPSGQVPGIDGAAELIPALRSKIMQYDIICIRLEVRRTDTSINGYPSVHEQCDTRPNYRKQLTDAPREANELHESLSYTADSSPEQAHILEEGCVLRQTRVSSQ
ncbi:uncharacterized protein MYCFIDRAFT_170661 [Pseudocercospora fijiensis CIRAD86]|uniref:Uncharacterized protein n=1 Tax=Pseudocercospora fijiensis (strain CIRAD86) TaxID=383855 RepID=N1Q8F4_PSEFD|nr:uncharacterized protein MYCFIDRAFT_170661 [Pseudocercospora fijiensis CIRAD86]EME89149.1 hypothetical protein MYCFIDRAFT_170661 [Pseudocercospora fijiensis CIRAD86]